MTSAGEACVALAALLATFVSAGCVAPDGCPDPREALVLSDGPLASTSAPSAGGCPVLRVEAQGATHALGAGESLDVRLMERDVKLVLSAAEHDGTQGFLYWIRADADCEITISETTYRAGIRGELPAEGSLEAVLVGPTCGSEIRVVMS